MLNELLIKEGNIVFSTIDEDGRKLEFNPPLKIEYYVYSREEEGKEIQTAYVNYDFGMTDCFRIDSNGNILCLGYDGLSEKSTIEEKVRKNIEFDLFHAFFHPSIDPNYSHLHWALFGWLNNRTKVIDDE